MYTNGFFAELPHEPAAVLAAVNSFDGACGFRRVSAEHGEFAFVRYRFFPDRISVTVTSAEGRRPPKAKIMGMLAPDPIRNWFSLKKPLRDISQFRTALFVHVTHELRSGPGPEAV